MPHNLYLHSALVKSRNVDRKKNEAVRQANMYYFVEAAIALLVCYTLDAHSYYAYIHTSYMPMYIEKKYFDRIFILVIFFSQISLVINVFVVAVFASGLHGKTNGDIHAECLVHNNTQGADVFPNNSDPVRADIYKGGVFLGCFFGNDLCAMKISFRLSSTNINVFFFT